MGTEGYGIMRWRSPMVLAGVLATCIGPAHLSCWADEAPADSNTARLTVPAGESVRPSVEAARQGRLLVLTYKPIRADGVRFPNAVARTQSPAFTVHQGKRKVVSGQFEFG